MPEGCTPERIESGTGGLEGGVEEKSLVVVVDVVVEVGVEVEVEVEVVGKKRRAAFGLITYTKAEVVLIMSKIEMVIGKIGNDTFMRLY